MHLANRPKAYSYLRFSTPEQMKGDSYRRQTEAAERYAEQHGLDLDTELTFQDLGVSAFRGANLMEGSLGKFIEAVDSGRVKPGSFLLVENLDRLSRDKARRALRRFEDLLERDISIVTLQDGKVWNKGSLDNIVDLIVSLLYMARANEESEVKATRLKAAWQNKRDRAVANGHKLTAQAPAWLKLNKRTGEFELIKSHVAVVQRIFQETLAGHGYYAIGAKLNAEKVPTFGKKKNLDGKLKQPRPDGGWYPSYVQKILRNEAVVGRYQPMRQTYVDGKKTRIADGPAIEGYFPAVISEEDFYRVKRMKPGATGKGRHPLANMLSGLVFCSKCGGKLHWVNKGKPPKGGSYLHCDNARRKKTCDARGIRYSHVIEAVFGSLEDHAGQLSTYALMSPAPEDRKQQQVRLIEVIEAQIAEGEGAIANLLDTLSRSSSPAIEKRLTELETKLAKNKEHLERLRDKLRELESGYSERVDAQEALTAFWNSVHAKGREDKAAFFNEHDVRLNASLKKLVDRIEAERGKVAIHLHQAKEPLVVTYSPDTRH